MVQNLLETFDRTVDNKNSVKRRFDSAKKQMRLCWDEQKLQMLRELIKEVQGSVVAIFRPSGEMNCFELNFVETDLSLLEMESLQQFLAPNEYYNILQIYLANGIVPCIKFDKKMLDALNREGIEKLTKGQISQTKLHDSDFLLLKY